MTVPFWYAEWMPRAVREKVEIKHESGYLHQIGNVCMNLSCYEWNDDILIWDKVVLLEKDQSSMASVTGWARASGSIPYEILVRLDGGVRREIVD